MTDMVRISDSRISGTTFGTIVCHVAPEAAVGGPIGLLGTGDMVTLDAKAGRLDVDVSEDELARRAGAAPAAARRPRRPPASTAAAMVRSFSTTCCRLPGADFGFLQNLDGRPADRLPLLLIHGWTSL